MSYARATLVATLLCVACKAKQEAPSAPAPAPKPALTIDSRDQYALLEELELAQAKSHEDRDSALADVRARWQGKRFHWEVAYLPALCSKANACFVMPFDRHKVNRRIAQGWLPKLSLDEEQLKRISEGCKSLTPCVFSFEGTLSVFKLSSLRPTALAFDDVKVHKPRAAAEGESWASVPKDDG